jgi:3-methyladenine DNA glycosylase/8-oxoguanine DNA glycosylase
MQKRAGKTASTITKLSLKQGQAYLSDVDPQMARLIERVGPTRVRSERQRTVYQSLVRAIVYQMLSTQSANAIHERLLQACPGGVTPQSIMDLGEQPLRDIGFSRAKVASAMDLSEKMLNGSIPDDRKLGRLDDEALIKLLTTVRGIGRWSVEVLMIFNLQRADVLPSTDLGIRKGHALAYGLDELLPAKQLARAGEVWSPHRSVASWYLWRATDSVDWSACD